MENIKINITSNGTTTLATAGKYCERNVDIDVLVSGGGGASLLDSEGSLFMTADEEAFCVDGNDRLFDVETFPKKPLDNVVYRKNEKTTTSDGQLTYINETTSYGIPVQTDHSNGLHYKNVEVLQYTGKETKTQAFMAVAGLTLDFMAGMSQASKYEYTYDGYKVVDTKNEVDKADTKHVYLIRATNIIFYYAGDWFEFSATEINSPSEIESPQGIKFYICYGKGGWESLTALKDYENKYFQELAKSTGVIEGTIKEIDADVEEIRPYAFYNCTSLKTANIPNHPSGGRGGTVQGVLMRVVGRSAFEGCTALTTLITAGTSFDQDALKNCSALTALVFVTDNYVCNFNYTTASDQLFLSGCTKILGETETGYIYVPLNLIDEYKTNENWSALSNKIMPFVETMSELYALDTSKYKIAYLGSLGVECKYENGGWIDLR